MSIALSEFWTKLVESGITDAGGCKRIAASFCDANQGTPPSESLALAKFLVKSGELTDYQARAILASRGLRLGSFVVRGDQAPPPLSRWIPVHGINQGPKGFLFRASPEHLAGGRDQWLEAHAGVHDDSLQPIQTESLGNDTAVFSPLPDGNCLCQQTGDRGLVPRREACQIGIVVAEALAALHTRSLFHGNVRPDRVWLPRSGKAILLRDPSGPAVGPLGDHSHSWLDNIERPESYGAPEFAAADQTCNAATDIYSLGCLLFRIVTGRDPFVGSSAREVIAAHCSETPPELAEAVQKGESGDALFRVLAFAMAKNPTARFATAEQLAAALRATLPLIPASEPVADSPPPAMDASAADAPSATGAAPRAKPQAAAKGESVPPPVAKSSRSERRATAKPATTDTHDPPKSKSSDSPKKKVSSKTRESTTGKETTTAANSDSPQPSKDARKGKRKSSSASPAQTGTKTKAKPGPPEDKPPSAVTAAPPRGNAETSAAAEAPRAQQAAAKPAAAEPPPMVQSPATAGPGPEQIVVTPAGSPPLETTHAAPPADDSKSSTATDQAAKPQLRRRKKKKSRAPLILGALCVPILMLMIGLMVGGGDSPEEAPVTRPPIPDVIPSVGGTTPDVVETETVPQTRTVAGYELVDDERLLWIPPYPADAANAPLSLLPGGPGAIVSVRLAELNSSSVGKELLDTLGPELPQLIAFASTRAKVPIESIRRCTVALHPGGEGWPEVSLAIELTEPQSLSDLTNQWNASASRTTDGATIYAGDEVDSDAYYVAPDDIDDDSNVSRFAVGSIKRISEVAENEGGEIQLPPMLKRLWNGSSDQADLVVLVTPNFLFADARSMLTSVVPELTGPLKSVLIPNVAGALVTADIVDSNLYAEVRMVPSGGVSEPALLRQLSEAIEGWPDWADKFIQDTVPDASWRLLSNRLPFMMRFVSGQTRYGISEGDAVANVYLPERAISQVSLAILLAMNTTPGATSVAMVEPVKPLTIDEILDRKTSVSFDQESLEFAINTIVDEFKQTLPAGSTMPPVRIVGSDLEKMGITQNQQIRDFSKTDEPLRKVLTDLVLGANPDKTATGPDDPKQSLIWVVAEDSSAPGQKAILVTTRVAAENKYELPPEFKVSDTTEQ